MANGGQTDRPEGTANVTNHDGDNRWERFARSKRFLPTRPLAAIGALAGFLAAVGGIITAVQAVWPHSKKSDLERVHSLSLSLGSDIDAVERNLGTNNRLTTYIGDSANYRNPPEGPTKDLFVRIYRLGLIFVQVGYQKSSGTVVEWIVQSCDPQVKIEFRRFDTTLTLNQTTFAQVTSGDLPSRARYSTWADIPSEQLEFSSPAGASNYISEIWGTNGSCFHSSWRGAGDEPLIQWNATPIEGDTRKPIDAGKEISWKDLQRYRHEKVVNLYGQAGPLDHVNRFPLLPGHGPPFEVTQKYLFAPSS